MGAGFGPPPTFEETTMAVRLLVPMAGATAWAVGDTFPCDDNEGLRLIAAGFAAPLSAPIERAVASIPETRKRKGK